MSTKSSATSRGSCPRCTPRPRHEPPVPCPPRSPPDGLLPDLARNPYDVRPATRRFRMTARITRAETAPPYFPAHHEGVAAYRLQGHESGPTERFWVGLSVYEPGGRATASPAG